MDVCNWSPVILPRMQNQKLLTLCWWSFLGWGRERAAIIFAPKGGQYLIYGCLQPITSGITQDARPKIIDAPLTVIFRMGQGACCYCFCLRRRPIPHLWMFATNCQLDYARCKTKHCWRSVDAHFQDGAQSQSLLFWPLKAANTSFMDVCNQSPLRLPKMQSQKLLTLRWYSISEWGSDHVTFSFAYKWCQYSGYACYAFGGTGIFLGSYWITR